MVYLKYKIVPFGGTLTKVWKVLYTNQAISPERGEPRITFDFWSKRTYKKNGYETFWVLTLVQVMEYLETKAQFEKVHEIPILGSSN